VLDYNVLKVLWWMILGMILVIYASTAGFDVGVTLFMPFLRNEDDRRVVLNTSAPTWDGNLTWIVFAGGVIFVAWPIVYSTAFSGLYAAMLLILFTLFLRPPGYEYRNKIPSHRWRRTWDVCLFISGLVPVFIFGVATGNCFVGFPFHFDPVTLREFYTGNFWQLLNITGILAGVVSVVMVLMHGAAYLQRRTIGHLRELGRKVHFTSGIILLALFSISGLLMVFYFNGYVLVSSPVNPTANILSNVVTRHVGAWFDSYEQYPWKYFGPMAAYGGIVVSLWASYYRWLNLAFWASNFAIGGIIGTAGFTLFPFIMPSSTNPNESITIWNAVSGQYGLNVMLYIGVVLLLIVLAYKIFAYHTIWSEQKVITTEDVHKNEHTFY